MSNFLVRIVCRRKQLTIGGMMIFVAIAAVLINGLRPITRSEAARIADARFREMPEAAAWAGRYQVNAWPAGSREGDFWFVDFEQTDGGHLAQVAVMSSGKVRSVGVDSARLQSGPTARPSIH